MLAGTGHRSVLRSFQGFASGCLWSCIPRKARPLTTRRIDVEENAEKNRENARLSVKTPTKNVEKVAYSGTHHKKTEYRNHKPRSN